VKFYVLEFELYFDDKYKLKVYFLTEKNPENKDCLEKNIKLFCEEFVLKYDYVFLMKVEYIYEGNEVDINKDNDKDYNIVITSGRFLGHVLKYNDKIRSILVFTSVQFLEPIKDKYLNPDNVIDDCKIKEVSTHITSLLAEKYFCEELNNIIYLFD
jgi:hypothetical protein